MKKIALCTLVLCSFLLSPQQVWPEEFVEKRMNQPLFRFIPIKCEAKHYVWAGMLKASQTEHNISILKDVNSTPLANVILEKKNVLMVDNEEFKIIKTNDVETFAYYQDDKNLLTVVLNYKYGTLLYSKVFTNPDFVGMGKQNAMSYVGICKNT